MKKPTNTYSAPEPVDEQYRIQVLKSLEILDTEPDVCLQSMVELAASATRSPIALISLVDENRQWFKAGVGLPESQTPRCQAFCGFTILQEGSFLVTDASTHPVFRDHPLVLGPPFIKAYLGVPIKVKGANIGSLCVIDSKARDYGMRDSNILIRTARMIEDHISLRYKSAE